VHMDWAVGTGTPHFLTPASGEGHCSQTHMSKPECPEIEGKQIRTSLDCLAVGRP